MPEKVGANAWVQLVVVLKFCVPLTAAPPPFGVTCVPIAQPAWQVEGVISIERLLCVSESVRLLKARSG
ncbi:MAG: hypothetical protein ACRDUB_19095, partial [Mycobacterium sp.]